MDEPLGREEYADEVEGSRVAGVRVPFVGGGLVGVDMWILSLVRVITIKSSSSESLATPFRVDVGSGLLYRLHLPSGSTVTWSTEREVFCKMSLTYLSLY
jgi:hypothetical protein